MNRVNTLSEAPHVVEFSCLVQVPNFGEGACFMTLQAAKTILVALGGNALIRQGERGTSEEQFANLRGPMAQIARLAAHYRIIITHGNGPQVGNLLLQQECCREVPAMPLEVLVAQTQGQIGYMIESTLEGALLAQGGDKRHLVSLISYVVVDGNDPAFKQPTKPIGPFYPADQVPALPWSTIQTPKGFRRVVASPLPVTVVEKGEIRLLIDQGFIVICCGGGGIPVIRAERGFHGVDAVIDKDLTSACLAAEIGVELLVIATDVPQVATGFGSANERYLSSLDSEEAEHLLQQGEFPPGSMGPKVTAALNFIRSGGSRAIICHLDDIAAAVAGQAGTHIRKA
jgi:carbamate kinase